MRDDGYIVEGTNTTTQPLPRLAYFPENTNIAVVDINGFVRGIKPGTTNVRVVGFGSETSFAVEVTPYTATQVIVRVLSSPTGHVFPIAERKDSGVFWALPGQSATSRLEGIVLVGTDTVYCNYCQGLSPVRENRIVAYRSLNPAKADVSNSTNPVVQGTTDGLVSALDTSANYVGIEMYVPGDDMADTAWIRLDLRPIDTLQLRPSSREVPSSPTQTGTTMQAWPGDSVTANVIISNQVNFGVQPLFRYRIRPHPVWPGTAAPGNPANNTVNASARPFLPVVTYESALPDYLDIALTTGNVIFNCEYIGKPGCLAPVRSPSGGAAGTQAARDSLVIGCVDNGKRLPGLKQNSTESVGIPIRFNPPANVMYGSAAINLSFLRYQGCPLVGGQFGPNVATPGAYCTSATASERLSQCTVWIRASFTDPATGLIRRYFYRITARRD
jgi:hypothetical protein